MNQTLDKFKEHLKKMRQYEQAVCLLNWDLQTMAPKREWKASWKPWASFPPSPSSFPHQRNMGLCCRSFPVRSFLRSWMKGCS